MKNPSTKQFAQTWNWMYDNKKSFDRLLSLGPYSVYGEWMVQQHGLIYDKLPSWFIVYDVFDYEKRHFLDTWKANEILRDCGFHVIECVIECSFYGESFPEKPLTYQFFEEISNYPSFLPMLRGKVL